MRLPSLPALAITTLVLYAVPALRAQNFYTVTDLGTLGGNSSLATDVNNAGQVVGEAKTVGGVNEAFIYSGGTMTSLGTLGGTNSTAAAINASGQIVGSSKLAGDTVTRSFLYSGGSMTDLGTLGGSSSWGLGINDAGAVVGYSNLSGNPNSRGFVYSGGSMTSITTPDPVNDITVAQDINSAGTIVGSGSFYEPPGVWSPYARRMFTNSGGVHTMTDFNGADSSILTVSINEAGYVVGTYVDPGFYQYSILTAPGSNNYAQLFTSYLGRDEANDINNGNVVVGSANLYHDYGPLSYAYRYDLTLGELTNLNSSTDKTGSGFTDLMRATGISDTGLIVGTGLTAGGETHAFLLTPIAPTLFWDTDGATAGLAQGNGTWSSGTGQWAVDATGGHSPVGWTNGAFARFGYNVTPATVTVTDAVSTEGILAGYTPYGMTIEASGGGTLTFVGQAFVRLGGSPGKLTISAPISGSAGLWVFGKGSSGGELLLEGNNDYTGQTRIDYQAYVHANHQNALGATGVGNETIVNSGGKLLFDRSLVLGETLLLNGGSVGVVPDYDNQTVRDVELAGPVVLQAASTIGGSNPDQNSSLTISGVISETGGPQNLTGSGLTLTGTNTFTGDLITRQYGVTVNQVTDAGVAGPMGQGNRLVMGYNEEGPSPGDLHYTGASASTNREIILEGGGAVDVQQAGTTLTLTGLISGQGLEKTGAGTLVLTGENTFTGGMQLTAGTLRLANTSGSALGTGDVSVDLGATLTGPGSFAGNLNLSGDYSPGDPTTTALVTIGGNVTVNSDGWLNFDIGGLIRGTEYEALNITGTLAGDGGLRVTFINGFNPVLGNSFDLIDSGSFDSSSFDLDLPALSGGLVWDTSTLLSTGSLSVVSAVPEPSTYAVIAGLAALGLAAWRRRTA